MSTGKVLEGALVLEEHYLTIGLSTWLQADAQLRHGGVTQVLAMYVHPARAVRTADDEARFAGPGTDGVAVPRIGERGARTGVVAQTDRVAVGVRAGGTSRKHL